MTASPVRCGVVGAGRSRVGLGPFLVRDLEAAGASVTAIAGRDGKRTSALAREYAERYDHPVVASVSVPEMLATEGLDAVVIAAPIEVHLPALRAAVEAGVHALLTSSGRLHTGSPWR